MNIKASKCYHHSGREAVARCPVCGNFFCRECVTEHDGKVICSRCLSSSLPSGSQKSFRSIISLTLKGAVGFFVLWLMFYYLGRGLLLLPTNFHDGTFWNATTQD